MLRPEGRVVWGRGPGQWSVQWGMVGGLSAAPQTLEAGVPGSPCTVLWAEALRADSWLLLPKGPASVWLTEAPPRPSWSLLTRVLASLPLPAAPQDLEDLEEAEEPDLEEDDDQKAVKDEL